MNFKKEMNNLLNVPSKQRKVLDIKTKKCIIELSEQGLSHQTIATKYSIGRSTVTKILLNKEHILQNSLEHFHDFRKRIRKGVFDNIETELFKWCTEGIPVSSNHNYDSSDHTLAMSINFINVREGIDRESILWKAEQLASEMNVKGFVANNVWFGKFKRKYYLNLKSNKKRYQDYSPYPYREVYRGPDSFDSPRRSYEHLSLPNTMVRSNVPDNVNLYNISKEYTEKKEIHSINNLLNPYIPVLKVSGYCAKSGDGNDGSPVTSESLENEYKNHVTHAYLTQVQENYERAIKQESNINSNLGSDHEALSSVYSNDKSNPVFY